MPPPHPSSSKRRGIRKVRPKLGPGHEIARVAASQRGVITTVQLSEAGLDSHAIHRRCAAGSLHRLHRGVYLVGHAHPSRFALETAALLGCRDGAYLSHASAGAIWGLCRVPDAVHVLATRELRSRRGVVAHRTLALESWELTERHGLRLTAPARTLIDLAALLPPRDLTRAVNEAFAQRLVDGPGLLQALELRRRCPGARGLGRCVRIEGAGVSRSTGEARLARLISRSGLPPFEQNAMVEGREVDFVWRAQRLIVEFDGHAFHSSPAKFEGDHQRDAHFDLAGWTVVRVTWWQLVNEPDQVIRRIRHNLAGRGEGRE